MTKKRAEHQDIRPLRILILNLMPNKITTETQLLRLLSNTPLQIEVTLIHMESHVSKNTSENHLAAFYRYWSDIKDQHFDGMIITGAPVENLEFEAVDYWPELCQIMDWSKKHVYSTLHICWGAQAGLYHHFQILKYPLKQKLSGIFSHTFKGKHIPLFKGFDDEFYVPHSRHTANHKSAISKCKDLHILAESKEAGACVAGSRDGRQLFISGHFEYDRDTLKQEYFRDLKRGLFPHIPKNYFPEDNSRKKPVVKWHSYANLLYYNWLNFYVYQETPFNIDKVVKK